MGSEIDPSRKATDFYLTASSSYSGNQNQSKLYRDLRKYDDEGNRYYYSVEEQRGDNDTGSYYGVTEQLGEGMYGAKKDTKATGFRVTNYEGYQAGTLKDGILWASDSSYAYMIGKDSSGKEAVLGTLKIGAEGALFGHGIAYNEATDTLYGVSNSRQLIVVPNASTLAKSNSEIVWNGATGVGYNETKSAIVNLVGIGLSDSKYGGKKNATHSLGITNDGKYLILNAMVTDTIYLIPTDKLTVSNLKNMKSFNLDENQLLVTRVISMGSTIADDGDIIQLPNGDLAMTGRPQGKSIGDGGDPTVYIAKYLGKDRYGRDQWGPMVASGTIAGNYSTVNRDPGYNQASTFPGTTEGLAIYDGKVYFSATTVRNSPANANKQGEIYLYPIVGDLAWGNPSNYAYRADESGRIDISQEFKGVTLSDMASSGPSTASQWVGTNVSKVWIGDTEEVRPKSITATLYTRTESGGKRTEVPAKDASGKLVQRILTADNNWMASIKAEDMVLPKYDANGREIWYVWKEDVVPSGYEGSVDDEGHVLTNVYHPSFVLPNTGGSGINAVTTSGLVLITGALLYGFAGPRRRRRFKEP